MGIYSFRASRDSSLVCGCCVGVASCPLVARNQPLTHWGSRNCAPTLEGHDKKNKKENLTEKISQRGVTSYEATSFGHLSYGSASRDPFSCCAGTGVGERERGSSAAALQPIPAWDSPGRFDFRDSPSPA